MNQETKTKNFSWLDMTKSVWYFMAEDKRKFSFYFLVLLSIFFYDLVPTYVVGKIIDFFTTYNIGQSLFLFYFYVIFISVIVLAVAPGLFALSKQLLVILGGFAERLGKSAQYY